MTAGIPEQGHGIGALITAVASGRTLASDEAEAAFFEVMEGRATPVQIGALLMGLRTRGESASEVAGGVRALRRVMVPVAASAGTPLVDTCGTGGGITTFNISTAAAILAAGAGVRIAKHGNRSFTSRSGSADVLEALGVTIELTPDDMARVLDDAGIVFMFAPLLHPAMRHVAPIRRELGIPTIMNLLGPITNPAGARRQLVGVSRPELLDLVAGALAELGHERALVVHGQPGLDELSPVGPNAVVELKDGRLDHYTLEPARTYDWGELKEAELAGGEPADNARIIESVLRNELRGAARAAVTLNAAAAIYLGGLADSLPDGVAVAELALDAGQGMACLERLRAATTRTAS